MELILIFSILLVTVVADKILSHSKILSKYHDTKINTLDINNNIGKEAIIILHGLLGSSRNFKTWATYLNDKLDNNYDIYCYDLRNHGRSTILGPLRMDYSQMASDVISTMQHLSISKAHLIGHSMGGKVAAAAALQYNSLNMFSSITMMDISPVIYTKEAFIDVSNTVSILKDIDIDFKTNHSKEQLNQRIIEAFPDTSLRLFVQSNLQITKDNKLIWNFNLNEIYQDIHNIADFPYDRSCVDINFNKPTLLLKGSNSNFVRSLHMPTITSLFPLYNLASIKDAGHWLHFDKPEESSSAVANFILSAIKYNQQQTHNTNIHSDVVI